MVRLRRSSAWLPALFAALALLLQVDAVVKSAVMTALAPLAAAPLGAAAMPPGAAAMPMCDGGMGGMAMAAPGKGPATRGVHRPAPVDAGARCPYCAAASHAPLTATAIPPSPCARVSFAAYRTVASVGPRGPPAIRPRARGPPLSA